MKNLKKIIGILSMALVFTACKQETKEKEVGETQEPTAEVNKEIVYIHNKNKNEFVLSFIREGDSVVGKFNYHLNGRDENNGTIKGVIKGNLLIADYDFMSEGINSTRQVVFKMEEGSLLEGYGDVIEKDGKVVYVDPSQLKYNEDFKLDVVK